jgi:uncharacterized protein YndB with AHSA1/START domain
MTTTESEYELAITRVFDAPRELVYKAFTDPDQLAQWFGPVGYTVPRETVDVDIRVGGYQRFVMVNEENPQESHPANAIISEVIENELIVGYEDVEGSPGWEGVSKLMLRLEFHDENGKTRLELRQGPYRQEMEGMARVGWESSFTKLDKLLSE